MSWALQMDGSTWVQFANNASLVSATAIYGAFSILGSDLNNLSGAGDLYLDAVMDSTKSTFKAACKYAGGTGAFGIVVDGAGTTEVLTTHTGTNLGSFTAGSYYDVAWVCDPSLGTPCQVTVYAKGDLGGTALGSWSNAAAIGALTTTAGMGYRYIFGAATFDWAKIGSDTTYAIENATLEEGSGTSVSPSGTINGTGFTWVSTGGGSAVLLAPPQGNGGSYQ